MAYSYNVYTGNGSTTQFTVGFSYVRREHVKVYVNYTDTAYTYVNSSTVQLATAPGAGVRVEVRRITPVASPLVDFANGSTMVAADLDTSNLQHLYLEQELDDASKQTIYVDPATGLLTAGSQQIKNVANPTSAQDAATKNYVDTADATLTTAAAAAQATANAALPKAGGTMTGVLSVTAGTAALPGIAVSGDPNTGIYSPGADQLAISTGGTGRVFVDASGNVNIDSNTFYIDAANNRVGIGTASPAYALDVTTGGGNGLFQVAPTAGIITYYTKINSGGYGSAIHDATQHIWLTSGTERARIDSSGRVGIGTASPAYALDVTTGGGNGLFQVAPTAAIITYYTRTNSGGYGSAINDATQHIWFTSGTERARIDSSGRLLVGTSTSSSTAPLQVNGVAQATKYSSDLGGTTASLGNGSFETILASPAAYGMFMVYGGGTSNTSVLGTAIVQVNGSGTPTVTQLTGGSSGIVIEASGNNVIITNATAAQSYRWKAVRFIGLSE